MGIGREPARVLATLTAVPSPDDQARARAAAADAPERPAPSPRREPLQPAKRPSGPESTSPAAEETRRVLRAVAAGLQLDTDVHVAETEDGLLATLTGDDLGVVIGKHGHTIDALQYLVNATLVRQHPGTPVIVDAHGYRKRRETVLRETATRAARDALRSGRPVALEPMSSIERKFVHLCLKERDDVETASEGRDPHRHIVVRPRA
jgi:spoIIIJ-associated protein